MQVDHVEVARRYDTIYRRLGESTVFQKILRHVFADDYESGLENFSFLRKSDLIKLEESLSGTKDNSLLLELGCGVGGLSYRLAAVRMGLTLGIDISPYAIGKATHLMKNAPRQAYFAVANMMMLPFDAHSIDHIVSIDAIHHACPYSTIAAEIARILKPGGTLTFSHWTHRKACLESPRLDPLYRELLDNGLNVKELGEVDPGLVMQLRVYATIFDWREQILVDLGHEVYSLLMNEAQHMWAHAGKVSRVLATFSRTSIFGS